MVLRGSFLGPLAFRKRYYDGSFLDPLFAEHCAHVEFPNALRASPWGRGLLGVAGPTGTLGRGALWASGVLGGWANGAFGGCSAAIPNGKPFRVDVILIETRFGGPPGLFRMSLNNTFSAALGPT